MLSQAGILLFAALSFSAPVYAEGVTAKSTTESSAHTQKLDQIAKTQQQILAELTAIKEELQIIKIRATR